MTDSLIQPFCMDCGDSFTNPVCHDCLIKEIEALLNDFEKEKGAASLKRKFRELNLKLIKEDTGAFCALCGEPLSICSQCFTKRARNIVSEEKASYLLPFLSFSYYPK